MKIIISHSLLKKQSFLESFFYLLELRDVKGSFLKWGVWFTYKDWNMDTVSVTSSIGFWTAIMKLRVMAPAVTILAV